MPVLSLRTRCLCKGAYLYGGVLQFSVPVLVIVTAFLFGLTLGAWALVVLGLVAWWFIIARLVANAITLTLAYGLGISREMRKVVRLEHRMEVAKQRIIDQFNAPPRRVARIAARDGTTTTRGQYIDGLTNQLDKIVSCLERIETELRLASPTPGAATPTAISGEEVMTPAACECGHVCRYAAENNLDPQLERLRAWCCICDQREPCSVCAPSDTPEAKQERERRYEEAREIVRPIFEPILREMLRDKPPEPKGK